MQKFKENLHCLLHRYIDKIVQYKRYLCESYPWLFSPNRIDFVPGTDFVQLSFNSFASQSFLNVIAKSYYNCTYQCQLNFVYKLQTVRNSQQSYVHVAHESVSSLIPTQRGWVKACEEVGASVYMLLYCRELSINYIFRLYDHYSFSNTGILAQSLLSLMLLASLSLKAS